MRGAPLKRMMITVLGLFIVLTFSDCAEIKKDFKKLKDAIVSKPEKEEKPEATREDVSVKGKAEAESEAKTVRVNKEIILLYWDIGKKIVIPEDLLKTRKPMPKSFLDQFSPKEKTSETQEEAPPEEKQEPELFGPKEYQKQ